MASFWMIALRLSGIRNLLPYGKGDRLRKRGMFKPIVLHALILMLAIIPLVVSACAPETTPTVPTEELEILTKQALIDTFADIEEKEKIIIPPEVESSLLEIALKSFTDRKDEWQDKYGLAVENTDDFPQIIDIVTANVSDLIETAADLEPYEPSVSLTSVLEARKLCGFYPFCE